MINNIQAKQNIFKYIFCFAFFVQILIIISFCYIFVSNISNDFFINNNVFFHINFFCIILSTIILFGFIMQDTYTKAKVYFILLDIILAFALAADSYSWLFDGRIDYKYLIIICFTIYHILNGVIDYLFWFFIEYTYDELVIENYKSKLILPHILLFLSFFIPIINAFTGLGTYVDANGLECDRFPYYICLHLPSLFFSLIIFFSIIKLKTSRYEKAILLSYITVPIIFYILSIFKYFDLNLYYPLLFAVYVFIFCNLVVEKEKENLQNEVTLAEKNNELNVANKIQKNMLPDNYKEYEKYGVDIFAYMDPAKEVGGDFYDYFMVDNDRLALVIADVSEKGVPASLFMSIGKILLKKAIIEEKSLPKAFNSLHKTIINNNKDGLFITLFAAIIDLKNNTMTYTNAGHCLPLFKKSGEKFRYLDEVHGTFVGCKIFESIEYDESTIEFKKGDILCLYTDGVAEAQNSKEELYGNEKLLNCINNIESNSTSKDIIENIMFDVRNFIGGYQQSDDITLLCMINQF